jgi:BppU N-terminal domain
MSFHLKQGDRLPALSATLQTLAGVAVNLTGGTVRFLMRAKRGDPLKVDAAAVIVDAAAGTVRYDWGATDSDTVGVYQGEFEYSDAGGKKETFPNDGYFTVVITDDIG